MAEEELLETITKARRQIKHAIVLAGLAIAVACVVLAIDQGIKRAIIEEHQKARGTLDQFRSLAQEVRDGTTETGEAGDPAGPALNGTDGVVHDATAGTVLGTPGGAAAPVPGKRPAGTKRGPAGNG